MVRKIKVKQIQNYQKYGDLVGYNFDSEEELKNKKEFVPIKPVKSDLQEVFSYGEHRKVELLTQRYELRITELEKELINDLKNRGVNVSEELRKNLLRLDREFVIKRIEPLYLENLIRFNYLTDEIEKLKERIAIEKYENYTCAKNGDGYNYSDDEDKIQEMINKRYTMKFELDDLKREYIQVKKIVEKYAEFFKK